MILTKFWGGGSNKEGQHSFFVEAFYTSKAGNSLYFYTNLVAYDCEDAADKVEKMLAKKKNYFQYDRIVAKLLQNK